MTIGRRTFLLGAALGTTQAAVANSLARSSTVQSSAPLLSDPLPPELAADGAYTNWVVFKIYGWDRCTSIADDPSGDQVLIRINQSWRTAWR